MATEIASAYLSLYAKMPGVQGDVAKQIGDVPADKIGEELGKKTSKGLKVGLAAAAGLAVAGLTAVFNTGMDELKFGEQISAQTDQLIKNTGAGFSTKFAEDYTLALSQVSGIAEEDLQAAGNSILKFGDVSKDTYKRSVDAINNMGAAGKDVAGTSEALGKALADPAKAAALLKRQGVLLNDEQKALIENFTATGDKAGAQGVILDALEGTYGGMAEAAGGTTQGQINKLGNTFENLSAVVVEAVMPAVSGLLDGLTGFFGWVQQNQGIIPVFAAVIGVILVAAFVAWTASIWAANAALLANPITWLVLAIVALIAIVVLLILNWDTVWAQITASADAFVGWFMGVLDAFLGWWNGLWTAVWEWIVSIWNGIVAIVTAQINLVLSIITAVGNAISSWWNGLWAGVASFFGGIWAGIIGAIQNVQAAFGTVFGAIGDIVRGAFDGVVSIIRGVINGIIGAVNGVIDGINGVAGVIGGAIGVNLHVGHIPKLADGGIISARPGGVIANIGEGRYDEAVVPLSPGVLSQLGGGGRTTVEVVQHFTDVDGRLVARQFEREFTGLIAGSGG